MAAPWQIGEVLECSGDADATGQYRHSFSVARVKEVRGEEVHVQYCEVGLSTGTGQRNLFCQAPTCLPRGLAPNFPLNMNSRLQIAPWNPPLTRCIASPHAQFVNEGTGQPLEETFSANNKFLRPALPQRLYRPDLAEYRVRGA